MRDNLSVKTCGDLDEWVEAGTVLFFIQCNLSHELKIHLLLGRKAMTNLDNGIERRHHFDNKCLHSQSYGVSSSHVPCEGWTIKKAEC